MLFRVNLPLALITTFYTNPFTIVPLYLAAFGLGKLMLGGEGERFIAPPDYGDEGLLAWVDALAGWMGQLGYPLAVGLILLGALLALLGYAAVRFAWRVHLMHAWHQRRRIREGGER